MSDHLSWHQKGERARRGLLPLHFLLGEWLGTGSDHGEPITARTQGQLLLDGSWLEVRERMHDGAGTRIYEDLSLYRFDPVEDGLRVLHLMPHGHYQLFPVIQREGGFRWATGPFGPKVDLRPSSDGVPNGWSNAVTLPDEQEAGLVILYRRPEA